MKMNVSLDVRARALICPTACPGASRKYRLPSPKKSIALRSPILNVELLSKSNSTTSRLAKASDRNGLSLFSG